MEITYRELFLLAKILVWLSTVGMQYWLYRTLRGPFEGQFTFTQRIAGRTVTGRHLLAAGLVLMNVPGLYITFGGEFGIPLWLNRITVFPYAFWQILTAVVLLGVLPLRALYKRLRGSSAPSEPVVSQQTVAAKQPQTPAPLLEAHPRSGDVVHQVESVQPFDPSRRRLLKTGFMAAPVAILGASSLGALAPENYEVTRQVIHMPNLPEKLKGLKVAVVSDIHSGPYMNKAQMDGYVKIINGLKADMILLPGDFVNNKNREIEPLCDSFQNLRADYGVYASLGNHDYFDDGNGNVVAREIANAGITMLRDEHFIASPRGEQLAIIGLEDLGKNDPFDPHFKKAVQGLSRKTPHILMCHKPYYIDDAANWGVQFMVSGHTHGGQIVFARVFDNVFSPATIVSSYIEGLHTVDATQMYITRGIGMVGVPVRWNCPPEVTLLTLE